MYCGCDMPPPRISLHGECPPSTDIGGIYPKGAVMKKSAKATKTTRVDVRMDAALRTALEKRAAEERRTVSAMCEKLLREAVGLKA